MPERPAAWSSDAGAPAVGSSACLPRRARRDAIGSRVAATACALVAGLASLPAGAYYEEAHVTGDEARVTVDPAGSARVEHTVAWQIVAGQYHFFDLTGVSGALTAEPDASVTSDDGHRFAASLVSREGGGLRVNFDDPRGVHHGRYKIRFAYREDFVKRQAFARDGALWRLTWQSPTFPDGYDGARVLFDLPPSMDPPRLADDRGEGVDLGLLSTFHHESDRDELELVKPHVARHESVTWAIRVAPRAFPDVRDPALRPPPPAPRTVVRPGPSPVLVFPAALAIALLYGALARKKSLSFDASCGGLGVRARGLVPLPHDLRAGLSGAWLGAGIVVEGYGAPTWGGACVAVAMLLAALRAPEVPRAAPRGPGRWLALRPTEAFRERRARDWFDPVTLPGACAWGAALSLLAATGWLLCRFDTRAPFLVALDALALLPLVTTGRRSQLPPRAQSSASWLGRLYLRLAKEDSLRLAPWVRVPTGCTEADELRVLVVPRSAIPGLVGIEVGMCTWHAVTCYGRSPEVLVRVHESSAASARMTTLAAFPGPVPGRLPEERVYRLVPRLPTRDGTARLVRRLGRELADRRCGKQITVGRPWGKQGEKERRMAIGSAAATEGGSFLEERST